MTEPPAVTDNQAGSRFEAWAGDQAAVLEYRRNGKRFVITHTEVPPQFRGQGIAGRLVAAAVDRAAHEGMTVVPLCPFARDWLERNPEAAEGVSVDWGPPPAG